VILRPDGLGKLKAVAANIDQVFIVIAEEPQAHPNLIDRYLVAAENANICAKIILNKCDIAISDENKALLDVYKELGYEVFYTSAESAQGLEEVKAALAGKTSIFAGQSGVGKSSLINTIMPELDLKVGRLSEHVVKGRHTTTSSSLFELINGGYLIDSPGIREFHLNHLERETIYRGYREFKDIQGQCHFRDCQHRQEPGCIYQEFIAAHGLSPTRLQSLNYILNNQDNL
jgi:ribosome biogenesis GTPase